MQCCFPVTAMIYNFDSTKESPIVVDFTVKKAFAKHGICKRTEQNIINVQLFEIYRGGEKSIEK